MLFGAFCGSEDLWVSASSSVAVLWAVGPLKMPMSCVEVFSSFVILLGVGLAICGSLATLPIACVFLFVCGVY